MRLTQKKIEEILSVILTVYGLPLIRYLSGKNNVSEFDLANKTKKDIKVVRRMLYILYNHNLVSFTRKKDKQKGWYIYYWTLQPESIKYVYFKKKREKLVELRQLLEAEKKELFFVCPGGCTRLNFDQAMDFEFHCPECGELVGQDSGDKRISELGGEITQIEGEMKEEDKKTEKASVKKVKSKTAVKNS